MTLLGFFIILAIAGTCFVLGEWTLWQTAWRKRVWRALAKQRRWNLTKPPQPAKIIGTFGERPVKISLAGPHQTPGLESALISVEMDLPKNPQLDSKVQKIVQDLRDHVDGATVKIRERSLVLNGLWTCFGRNKKSISDTLDKVEYAVRHIERQVR